tara:strand:- start:6883 stop:7269 length:387 start_codon:yes stop_codon:yes gene_type:complete
MKYFESVNNLKVVKPDLPQHITTLKDTRKEDWIEIYTELGFYLADDFMSFDTPNSDYLMGLQHGKDELLSVRHWHSRGTHHLMPLRTANPKPLDLDYKEQMIIFLMGDPLCVVLENLLKKIRSFYVVV